MQPEPPSMRPCERRTPSRDGGPSPNQEKRIAEEQDTLMGLAQVLQRELPDRTISDLWADALSIYRVQYERILLPPPESKT